MAAYVGIIIVFMINKIELTSFKVSYYERQLTI
jgi:hypothetical protein